MSRVTGAEVFAAQSDAMAYRDDVRPRLQEIMCPVLCLWGEHDKFAAVQSGQEIATAVPEGKCLVLKNCGHLPTLEYPAEAAEAVREWLKAITPGAARKQKVT